jgi:hypothetical protein
MIQHPGFAAEPSRLRETELHLGSLAQTESVFALANGHVGPAGGVSGVCGLPASGGRAMMPFHLVLSLLHFVMQWMSTVTSSAGSAVNSSHVHECDSSTVLRIENVHFSSGVRGVGPADRTGKPRS